MGQWFSTFKFDLFCQVYFSTIFYDFITFCYVLFNSMSRGKIKNIIKKEKVLATLFGLLWLSAFPLTFLWLFPNLRTCHNRCYPTHCKCMYIYCDKLKNEVGELCIYSGSVNEASDSFYLVLWTQISVVWLEYMKTMFIVVYTTIYCLNLLIILQISQMLRCLFVFFSFFLLFYPVLHFVWVFSFWFFAINLLFSFCPSGEVWWLSDLKDATGAVWVLPPHDGVHSHHLPLLLTT